MPPLVEEADEALLDVADDTALEEALLEELLEGGAELLDDEDGAAELAAEEEDELVAPQADAVSTAPFLPTPA